MAKTRRLLIESLKLVDVVVELLDARAPRATANPDLDLLLKDKTRIIVLNKCDLADLEETKRWVLWYEAKGLLVLPFNSSAGNKKAASAVIEKAAAPLVAKMKEKGVKSPKELFTDDSIKIMYSDMEQTYVRLHQLGYRRMPEEMYMQWMGMLKNEPEKYIDKK